MVRKIIRKRVRGRKLDEGLHWRGWKDRMPGQQQFKRRDYNDAPIAPGYKMTRFARVPPEHRSSKKMQDSIEEKMLRAIRRETPGPRKEYLIKEYHHWVQAGKPTAISQHLDRSKNAYEDKRLVEYTPTWKNKPEYMDFIRDNEERRKKRALKS